jgi:hypothetical protein
MKIAAEHSERQGVTAGINVEKRFLLNRVARQAAGHVTERHAQLTAVIEADFADTPPPRRQETAMPARHTTNAPIFGPPELSDDSVPIQCLGQ